MRWRPVCWNTYHVARPPVSAVRSRRCLSEPAIPVIPTRALSVPVNHALLMVVDDLDIDGAECRPRKYDAVPIVDPNTVLALSIAL